jgi:hypothetical protein
VTNVRKRRGFAASETARSAQTPPAERMATFRGRRLKADLLLSTRNGPSAFTGSPKLSAAPSTAALSVEINVPLQYDNGLVSIDTVTSHDPSNGVAAAVAGKAVPDPACDIETFRGIGVKRTRTTLPIAVRVEWPQRRRGGDEVGKQTFAERCERLLHNITLPVYAMPSPTGYHIAAHHAPVAADHHCASQRLVMTRVGTPLPSPASSNRKTPDLAS